MIGSAAAAAVPVVVSYFLVDRNSDRIRMCTSWTCYERRMLEY
jgi:hypothetical protein